MRVLSIIPTVSLCQIWDVVGNALQVEQLYLRVDQSSQSSTEQVNEYMKIRHYPLRKVLEVNYIRSVHGPREFGELVHDVEAQGFAEPMAIKMVIAGDQYSYVFINRKAPPQLQGYVQKLRKKWLRKSGYTNMEMRTKLFPRILVLSKGIPRVKQHHKHRIADEVIHTTQTFTSLTRRYGPIFVKVLQDAVDGKITRYVVVDFEDTTWFKRSIALIPLGD